CRDRYHGCVVDRSPRTKHVARFASLIVLVLAGCSIDGLVIWSGPGLGDDESSEGDSGDGDDGIEGNDDDASLLDLPEGEGEQQAACVVPKGQLDAALPCNAAPTSSTLAPVVAWTWT